MGRLGTEASHEIIYILKSSSGCCENDKGAKSGSRKTPSEWVSLGMGWRENGQTCRMHFRESTGLLMN